MGASEFAEKTGGSEMKHQISQALLDEAIRLRREFHEYCEPGWLEMRTASRVAGILTDLGYEVRLGR